MADWVLGPIHLVSAASKEHDPLRTQYTAMLVFAPASNFVLIGVMAAAAAAETEATTAKSCLVNMMEVDTIKN